MGGREEQGGKWEESQENRLWVQKEHSGNGEVHLAAGTGEWAGMGKGTRAASGE